MFKLHCVALVGEDPIFFELLWPGVPAVGDDLTYAITASTDVHFTIVGREWLGGRVDEPCQVNLALELKGQTDK